MITKLKRYIGFHFSQLLYILFVYLFFPLSALCLSIQRRKEDGGMRFLFSSVPFLILLLLLFSFMIRQMVFDGRRSSEPQFLESSLLLYKYGLFPLSFILMLGSLGACICGLLAFPLAGVVLGTSPLFGPWLIIPVLISNVMAVGGIVAIAVGLSFFIFIWLLILPGKLLAIRLLSRSFRRKEISLLPVILNSLAQLLFPLDIVSSIWIFRRLLGVKTLSIALPLGLYLASIFLSTLFLLSH